MLKPQRRNSDIMNEKLKTSRKVDFTEGPLFSQMLRYAIPVMLTGLLQICYNLADNIIVGKFSGDEFALAAVGATSELTRMIINLLIKKNKNIH